VKALIQGVLVWVVPPEDGMSGAWSARSIHDDVWVWAMECGVKGRGGNGWVRREGRACVMGTAILFEWTAVFSMMVGDVPHDGRAGGMQMLGWTGVASGRRQGSGPGSGGEWASSL
jgi:hypothetical protein